MSFDPLRRNEPVEIADQISRKRPALAAAAAVAFVAVQVIANPFFGPGPETARHLTPQLLWAVNAAALLLMLATGGGLLNSRDVHALVNDEVSRSNQKTAVAAGYWVAMATAMGVYALPVAQGVGARAAVYLVVTCSIAVAL